MSHSDSNFYRPFAYVLGALVLFTLLCIYLANKFSPASPQDPLAEMMKNRAAAADAVVAGDAADDASESGGAAAAAVVTAVATTAAVAASGEAAAEENESTAAVAEPEVVAEVIEQAPTAQVDPSALKVQATVATNCAGCHASGLQGAAKADDAAAWTALAEKGIHELTASVINGKGKMPARAESRLDDAQIQQAVELMIAQATDGKVTASATVPAATATAAAATTATAAVVAADAAEHTVSAVGVKFDPMFIYINPGDTVNWVGMAGHNVETIDAMIPEGQEKILSVLGDNVSATFTTEGIVVYKCTPHWGSRMGGTIVVGNPADSAAIIDSYLESIKTNKQNLPAKGLLKKLKKDMIAKGLLEG